jgi:hypothetical protein
VSWKAGVRWGVPLPQKALPAPESTDDLKRISLPGDARYNPPHRVLIPALGTMHMSIPGCSIRLPLLLVLVCGCWAVARAQDEKKSTLPNKSTERTEDNIIKISTDLIQTGVSVFDKKGQFVNDLRREDFELSVEGKPVSLSFFERNTVSESGGDEAKPGPTSNDAPGRLTGRGRTILFVVDDSHLSPANLNRVKKLISDFIEQIMPEDTVAIVSPSGNIGFLQQFTNDRTVLRAAVERLIYTGERSANDRAVPPMSEYEALLISQYDLQVTDFFADSKWCPASRQSETRLVDGPGPSWR